MLSPACPVLAVQVCSNPTDFQLLEDGWKALFERHGGWNVFLSWQWFREWWAAFGSGNQLQILTLSRDDCLVGIVPAMIETDEAGRRQLTLIGSDRTTDYGDVLVDPAFTESLCEKLADFAQQGFDRWDRVEFRGLPAASPLLGTFREAARRRGLTTLVNLRDTCPQARLAPTWEEYLSGMRKQDRHELRRKIRRAVSAGDPGLLCLTSPHEVAAGLDSFLRLCRASDPEKAQFLDDTMVSFFRAISLAFSKQGWMRLNLLKLDGREVAGSISFSRGDRVLLYNSGLDPQYRVHSVGIALHAAEMQQAIDQGKVCYDFLRGNELYKYGLGAQDSPIYTLTLLSERDGGDGNGRK